jgi:hypothetical protein
MSMSVQTLVQGTTSGHGKCLKNLEVSMSDGELMFYVGSDTGPVATSCHEKRFEFP